MCHICPCGRRPLTTGGFQVKGAWAPSMAPSVIHSTNYMSNSHEASLAFTKSINADNIRNNNHRQQTIRQKRKVIYHNISNEKHLEDTIYSVPYDSCIVFKRQKPLLHLNNKVLYILYLLNTKCENTQALFSIKQELNIMLNKALRYIFSFS